MDLLNFNGGSGGGVTYHIEGTTASTVLNAGAGTVLVDVSPTAKNLDTLAGPLAVHGGGATQLVFDDQNANSVLPILTEDTLTGTSLIRVTESWNPPSGIPNFRVSWPITYSGLAGLTLNTGATTNLVHVEATSAATTIDAGTGNALVDVSPTAKNLDAIAGALTVHGGGATQLVIDDQDANLVAAPLLTDDTLTGTALARYSESINPATGVPTFHTASVTYSGLAGLTLNTGFTTNLVHVEATSAATTIDAGTGNRGVDVSPVARNLDAIAGAPHRARRRRHAARHRRPGRQPGRRPPPDRRHAHGHGLGPLLRVDQSRHGSPHLPHGLGHL